MKTVWQMVRALRARHQARARLQSMTARDLADIGLTEGDRFALLSRKKESSP
jgi:uncharacterized protein YjiS (DUF1127 family)